MQVPSLCQGRVRRNHEAESDARRHGAVSPAAPARPGASYGSVPTWSYRMTPSPDLAEQHAAEQAPLEAVIKGEVLRMYQEVADNPRQEFHFFHGREAAEMFGYEAAWLDRAPAGA